MSSSIHQHNIGTIPVKFDSIIYDNDNPRFQTESHIISHKMKTGQSQIRNIENYYNKYPKEDIYILQEVQGGLNNQDKIINFGDDKYYYSYTRTGHLFYTNENEKPYPAINHGCAVLFNANKYEFIDDIIIDNTRTRTSKFILFADKFNIYAALSLHCLLYTSPSPRD